MPYITIFATSSVIGAIGSWLMSKQSAWLGDALAPLGVGAIMVGGLFFILEFYKFLDHPYYDKYPGIVAVALGGVPVGGLALFIFLLEVFD